MNAPLPGRPMPSLLLLGPTGSGKTPLGEELERRGLGGRGCFHFDFGAQLRRAAAAAAPPPGLTAADQARIRHRLETATLFEDDEFPLVERLLRGATQGRAARGELVVLNGLPRHVGQARALAPLAQVIGVVVLRCDAETVRARLARDTGGDRAGRVDDDAGAVAAKLEIFRERTAPLASFYRAGGARLVDVPVTADQSPAAAHAALEAAWSG
jgi:adenylate kinase